MSMIWETFYDVPYIRQESHFTCWYAATHMVRGCWKDKSEWTEFIEKKMKKQRMEKYYGESNSIKDRRFIGELYPATTGSWLTKRYYPYFTENERFLHDKINKIGLNTSSDEDLKQFYDLYGMKKLNTDLMQKQLNRYDVAYSNKDTRTMRNSLHKLYKKLKEALENHGPLLISIDTGGSRHMLCINGIGYRENMLGHNQAEQNKQVRLGLNYIWPSNDNDRMMYLHIIDPEAGRGGQNANYRTEPDAVIADCFPMPIRQLVLSNNCNNIFYFAKGASDNSYLKNKVNRKEHQC